MALISGTNKQMILAIDIGNTTIQWGLFKDDRDDLNCVASWRTATSDIGEYGKGLTRDVTAFKVMPYEVTSVLVASVVPEADEPLKGLIKSTFAQVPRFTTVGDVEAAGVTIGIDIPEEAGADRVVNCVAIRHIYRGAGIIVDFGTALTFDYISPSGEYRGGAILSGIETSMRGLTSKASKLTSVDLGGSTKEDVKLIGTNTKESLRSGFINGYTSLVDGMVERFLEEVGGSPVVIATGGAAHLVGPRCRTVSEVDPELTLKGLKVIGLLTGAL